MSTFTIDSDSNITSLTGLPAGGGESQSFSNANELAKLTAEWPASRLVETWNSFAGVALFDDLRPVKKFTSRKAAIARIWRAITRLSPDGATQAEPGASIGGKAKKPPAMATRRVRAKRSATGAASNKKAEVIAMMRRATGATLAEIVETTDWQQHTVRGFISILGSKAGLKIVSSKNTAGKRTYRIGK